MGRTASRFLAAFIAAAATLAVATTAAAHPHVLPTVGIDVIFGSDGRAAAIRHSWSYDPAYSAFVMRGIDTNGDGIFAEKEFTAFAKSQLDALAEHHYFTTVKTNRSSIGFGEPEAYSVVQQDGGRLLLKFTLPLKTVPAAVAEIVVELHDPNYFAYFTMADGAVNLVGAHQGCVPSVVGPQPINLKQTRSVPAAFWQALDGMASASAQFVNRITVKCQ